MDRTVTPALRAVARLCGIATSYLDFKNRRIHARYETILALINLLTGNILPRNPSDAELLQFLSQERKRRTRECFPSTIVIWNETPLKLQFWTQTIPEKIEIILKPDGEGEQMTFSLSAGEFNCRKRVFKNGHEAFRIDARIQKKVPFGYYKLEALVNEKLEGITFLISAPEKLNSGKKIWGAFAPAYALQSENTLGLGGYAELKQAATFIKVHGGRFLGTLPLLATFNEGEHANPSPYSPVSRLFWNEIFLDLENLPGWQGNISAEIRQKLERLAQSPLVDYAGIYNEKKYVLTQASKAFFQDNPGGGSQFHAYALENPEVENYALFRGKSEEEKNFHRYVQYACHCQLQDLKEKAHKNECAMLYIDYPIGVHSQGFDAWKFGHLFIKNCHVGAPPDMFFDKGQNWGFFPFHPRGLQQDHFRYFRATIHNYFKYATMLRLDHVMGFYRIYCIPEGAPAKNGTYIFYPSESFFAILCLESWRHDGILIGEDLGTVPETVRTAMQKHNFNRMWLFQFDAKKNPKETFRSISSNMIAAFNTHDIFPFEAFLEGEDLREFTRLGLLDEDQARESWKERKMLLQQWRLTKDPFFKALEGIAASPSRFVMVNMEDLWQETRPQNIPGTVGEVPNWRRKFTHPIENWNTISGVGKAVSILNRYRNQ